MNAKLLYRKLAFLLLPALILLPIIGTNAAVQAENCVSIQSISFNLPIPLVQGEAVKFGVSLTNNCRGFTAVNIQCKIDGELWDSGYVTMTAYESTTLWSNKAWTAKAGDHTVTIIADDNSLTRRFIVKSTR